MVYSSGTQPVSLVSWIGSARSVHGPGVAGGSALAPRVGSEGPHPAMRKGPAGSPAWSSPVGGRGYGPNSALIQAPGEKGTWPNPNSVGWGWGWGERGVWLRSQPHGVETRGCGLDLAVLRRGYGNLARPPPKFPAYGELLGPDAMELQTTFVLQEGGWVPLVHRNSKHFSKITPRRLISLHRAWVIFRTLYR